MELVNNNRVKRIKEFFDSEASGYGDAYIKPGFRAEDLQTYSHIKILGSTLDIGCGPGSALHYLDIPINYYIGVDLSKEMTDVAHNDFPQSRS